MQEAARTERTRLLRWLYRQQHGASSQQGSGNSSGNSNGNGSSGHVTATSAQSDTPQTVNRLHTSSSSTSSSSSSPFSSYKQAAAVVSGSSSSSSGGGSSSSSSSEDTASVRMLLKALSMTRPMFERIIEFMPLPRLWEVSHLVFNSSSN
jgi:hypothetical protein